jgi:hypothetical protein
MLPPKDRDKSDDRLFLPRRLSGNTLEAKHFREQTRDSLQTLL